MMQQQAQQKAGNAITDGVINTAATAAEQDLQQTGGQGIAQMAQQLGIDPQQIVQQLGGQA